MYRLFGIAALSAIVGCRVAASDCGSLDAGCSLAAAGVLAVAAQPVPTESSQAPCTSGEYANVINSEASLVSYWRLAETSGTNAYDRKGTNTGSYVNVTLGSAGIFPDAKAADFNGTSSDVTVPTSTSFDFQSTFSFEGWVKPQDTSSANLRTVLGRGNTGGGSQYALRIEGGGATAAQGTGFNCGVEGQQLSAGRWYHLVGFTKDNLLWVYVDGALDAKAFCFSPVAFAASNQPLYIGRELAGLPRYFQGTIAEAAVYNAPLSAERIAAHYKAGACALTQ